MCSCAVDEDVDLELAKGNVERSLQNTIGDGSVECYWHDTEEWSHPHLRVIAAACDCYVLSGLDNCGSVNGLRLYAFYCYGAYRHGRDLCVEDKVFEL